MSDQESALLPGPVELPTRRKLEQHGTRFTNAFCNTPQCSAARSSLLTGLEPHRTGVLTNVDASSLGKPLSPELPTVGSVFQKAGYATAYFGKWHLGNDSNGLGAFGFAKSEGRGDDEMVAKQASDWLRAQRGPWLAWVSFINPHDIYGLPRRLSEVRARPGVKPPATNLSNLKTKPAEQFEYVEKDQGRATRDFSPEDWVKYRSYYCELVEKVDVALGTVLAAAGDLDSTIVAYTSDHGDALGEHGLPFKGPFMYEPLIRIPLLIAARGMQTGVRGDMVTQCDLAPTVSALANVPWPARSDGRSLTQPIKRDGVFLEYYAKQKWVNPLRTLRTRGWKLNWYDRGNKELYDLNSDPDESRNLAGDHQHQAQQSKLERRLNAWRGPHSNP